MTEIVEVLQINKLQQAHIIQEKHSTTNRDSSVSVTQKKTVPRPEQTPWNLTLKQSEKCHIIYCVRERRKFIVCPCRHSVGRVNLSGLLCVCVVWHPTNFGVTRKTRTEQSDVVDVINEEG